MMTEDELAHSGEILRQLDELLDELRAASNGGEIWLPLDRARAASSGILDRAADLRRRLTAPLVVATFGGTGTGKSTLVNAIAGEECSNSGRERPTTRKPVLIMHTDGSAEGTHLNLNEFEIKRVSNRMFKSLLLIDCPDLDTSEVETEESNLKRLHRLLPHCDVLIYCTTQQKYHSARVNRELESASSGCRLFLVQTHADLDVDIREDWKRHLSDEYEISEMFFVDSIRALEERSCGSSPSGEFGRLMEAIHRELDPSRHLSIRGANLLDLIQSALECSVSEIDRGFSSLQSLETALEGEKLRLIRHMGDQLERELLIHQRMWERRVLTALAEYRGISPFATALRLYNGLGGLLASASLLRARSSAQVAVIGALQGARWLNQRREATAAEEQLTGLTAVVLDDAALLESQVLIAGYIEDAQLLGNAARESSIEQLRKNASTFEESFFGSVALRMGELIDHLARERRWSPASITCDWIFSLFLAYLFLRIGKNFFWDSAFSGTAILDINFYLPALLFTTLLAGSLIAFFTRTIREELISRIRGLAHELALSKLAGGLFPELELSIREIFSSCERFRRMERKISSVRSGFSGNAMSGRMGQ